MHQLLGVLGGSFDPVHFGHIKPALEMSAILGLAQVRLLPCRISPLKRQTYASSADRVNMLNIVADNMPGFVVDERELRRETPSYSYFSVKELQTEFPDSAICWLMGQDSFMSLPAWHRVQEFVQRCHLIVAVRDGFAVDRKDEILEQVAVKECLDYAQLVTRPGAYAVFLETQPIDVSSTRVRTTIESGQSPKYMMPGGVWNYIKRNRLYGYREEIYEAK